LKIQNTGIIPFLKWAGGKRWLIKNHPNIFPTNYNTFIEPFVGGGSVYFHLCPDKAIISDLNSDLINTYESIKNDWKYLFSLLKIHHRKHNPDYYYKIRDSNYSDIYKKAARFIYLNRTCWNGLYRVNLNGKYNVPVGTKTNVILSSDNFKLISDQLKDTKILNSDFESIVKISKKGDLLFADPPYTVQHNNNGFLKYNEKLFHWNDQVRLRDSLVEAKRRGVKIIVTNADHPCIHELYKDDFEMFPLKRISKIAAKSEFRNPCNELIIRSM
jgi:DNA adenine methylase